MAEDIKTRSRRQHSAELKARVLAECAVPGASVSAVALAHGLNTNLVHTWRRLARPDKEKAAPAQEFIALPWQPPAPPPSSAVPAPAEIRIELRRGAVAMNIAWPVAAATECAAWLRELLG